ncbi:protein ACCELERATED CELL DEATH 6 [Populus alba]|uniref:Protein ACCELERATED CELL DEATH 6-like isoform X2 n=3 Tax=Populus TaxID=3689 RepID=A0AAD6LBT2_9ROSI|nr:protein ACCELERATED CELL DEATH 6-like isoform X2 [Populus alba]KAJ6957795.1 protein ACCELERATED CELL DEATH 6-like isoform X2 [Populus alba x Populus x berolinensis]
MPRPVHEELKFPVPKDYVFSEPNKILQKDFYTYAKEDNFNALFYTLEHVSLEEALNIIFKHVAASGNSLLHVAASQGSGVVTQLLCHHFPLLITRKNFLGDNALHLAARAGRFDTIQILVKHVKIDPHKTLDLASLLRMKNNKGNTPLHDAVIKGCREVACFLLYEDLEVSYHKNKEDKSPLYLAVESCDAEMIASFKEAMPEGNLEKLAVGKPDIMLPEDIKGGNLLHLAASMGFLSGARLLVSRCPVAASQTNDEGNLPIHVACQKGHLKVVRELLTYWFDPMDFLNEKGQNILHVAAESGQRKIVDEILRNQDLEALINEKDYDGNTPLHLAAMYCRSEIVRALVSDKRVDKRIVNNEKLNLAGVVAILLRGGRFEAPKSDGMSKRIDTRHEDDAARGVWNKSLKAAFRKIQVLVEADDMDEFHINLISNLPRTTLTTEELNRGVGNLLVVAILVVGVTFAGAITVPGSCRDLNSGSSTNLMRAYIFFDMLAMNFSLIAAIILCRISLGRTRYVPISMEMATYCNFYSLICMGLAFTFMLTITVQERTGFFITIITFQAFFYYLQFLFSNALMLSTGKSLLSVLRTNPLKFSIFLMGRE